MGNGRKQIPLEVDRVWKMYPRRSLFGSFRSRGSDVYALRDISFSVQEGQTLGLLGPNGAGKTTLLKIIATLLFPTSGTVSFYGHNAFEQDARARRMLGIVTCDERSFYWRLSGVQNLKFFAALYGVPVKQATQRIGELIEILGLSDAADRPFHSYSSGMKQKLAIARGLLGDPHILLYDEPTRSLDPLSTQNIRKFLREHRAKSPHQTHLIATNQLQEAEQLCDQVLVINRGAILASGTIQRIRNEWRRHDRMIHRITYRGRVGLDALRSCSLTGPAELEQESTSADQTTVRLRTPHESPALSCVLERILAAGGEVLQCDSGQAPFDEVFCSMILEDQNDRAELAGKSSGEPAV